MKDDREYGDLCKHLDLLSLDTKAQDESEISGTPIFTEAIRQHGNCGSHLSEPPFSQYGLLGGNVAKMLLCEPKSGQPCLNNDPRVYFNVKPPSSVFICGSQGSGKSHTLSCLLENCLIPTEANVLPQPLTGIVFHYDPFFSDTGGSPCEAAYLSSHMDVKVRVLCAPTNVAQIKQIYAQFPNIEVQELRLGQEALNTKRMLDLMAFGSNQDGGMPLYLHVIIRILRELRVQQQMTKAPFNYAAFKRALSEEMFSPGQKGPLDQRLETLESFMATEHLVGGVLPFKKKPSNSSVPTATSWAPQAGQISIVDLSCPCVTAESACALFNICLNLFLEQDSEVGRIVALDEAHKYMTESAECNTLTETLLSTIRLQRHLGARVFISTQEPTVSPKLLDLCTVTIVHRFTSPDWLASLKKHLAAATPGLILQREQNEISEFGREDASLSMSRSTRSQNDGLAELFSRIVSLRTGEALLFCPSAIVGVDKPDFPLKDRTENGGILSELKTRRPSYSNDGEAEGYGPREQLVHLGHGVMKIRIRKRVTEDGGKSVMAG